MNREKHVDESWKESVELEKEKFSVSEPGLGSLNQNPASNPQDQASPADQPKQENLEEETIPGPQATNPAQMHFLNYISSLAFQAMIFLGEIPHPQTNLIEKDYEQAKFLIDTLILLREKTKGNLSRQESDMLKASIYELQMKFVEATTPKGSPQ